MAFSTRAPIPRERCTRHPASPAAAASTRNASGFPLLGNEKMNA
jgi:hypothetical protein